MAQIEWTPDLETGISVIDGQHRRIVVYINTLDEISDSPARAATGRVIDELIDYTYSHFAFEEALMEQAGYEFLALHKGTHDAFRERVDDFKQRFDRGEDVTGPLAELLRTWLISHIRHDDAGYAPLVREKMPRIQTSQGGSWLNSALRRFFS